MNNKKLRVLSLFSGIGAFEKAISNLNIDYELVAFSEIDKYSIKSYCSIHNVDENLNLGDISLISESKLKNLNIDLIVGGSPCQDFSTAGKQKGSIWTCNNCGYEYNPLIVHHSSRSNCPICNNSDLIKTRSSLVVEMLRVIKITNPKYVVYENVKNITNSKFKNTFNLFLNELREYGYYVDWSILNSKDFNSAQSRERVFVVCSKIEFPSNIKNLNLASRKTINDILDTKNEHNYLDKDAYTLIDTPNQQNAYKSLMFIGYLNKKTRFKNPSSKQLNYSRTHRQANRIYSSKGISPTLLAQGTQYLILDSIGVRKIISKEAFRLMGFDDIDYFKCLNIGISNTQLFKQAGNSIVIPVLEEIFKFLLYQQL